MDELARRYLLLGLRLERIAPGFVDSYVGPAELAEAVAGEPPPLASELHDEAMALRDQAAELPGEDAATVRRRRWMDAQLTAICALARRAGGEEIIYLDFVEQLYGVPIAPTPEDELAAARGRLDAALPGSGSLAERMQAMREALKVPPDRVLEVLSASADRFRAATARDFELANGETIDWEAAHDQPWGAYATFAGGGRTRILVNLDLPIDVPLIAYLAAHEAYPGHHTEHVSKERTLIGNGVGEAMLRTMSTPEAMLAEGQADIGREVVMTDRELEDELARIGADTGVTADWAAAAAVQRVWVDLAPVMGNAAIMLHHDRRPEAEVRDWLTETSVQPPERIDHTLRVLADPVGRTYPFTYTEGVSLIRPWLEVTGQATGFARLLSEQLSPAQLQAETGEPQALYPAGFP